MEQFKEIILDLPWSVVDACRGFGLDIGTTVCKIVYLHKDDWTKPDNRTTDTVPLRCISIARAEFVKALDYLKDRTFINKEKYVENKQSMIVTGLGTAEYAQAIEETMGIKIETIPELECFVPALRFLLENRKKGEIEQAMNLDKIKHRVQVLQYLVPFRKQCLDTHKNMNFINKNLVPFSSPMEEPIDLDKGYLEDKDLFPCFMIMVGSLGGILLVNKDGSFSAISDFRRAGRQFLGLASLLTKSKSFSEIMDKASKGSNKHLHMFSSDVSQVMDKTRDNFYSEILSEENTYFDEIPVMPFDKAVYKDIGDFKSEDLARSFLYMTVDDIVQVVHLTKQCFPKVKHVFWSGGFPDNAMILDMITEAWLERESILDAALPEAKQAQLHFLKHGQFLGALGAFLHQHLNSSEEPGPSNDQ